MLFVRTQGARFLILKYLILRSFFANKVSNESSENDFHDCRSIC